MNQEEHNKYIELYKKMSLKDKKEALEKEIKDILIFLMKLHEEKGWKADLLLNKEVLDIRDANSTEDDFVEAMFVYILSIQEMLASYIDLSENK